jgi:hypothetical protein
MRTSLFGCFDFGPGSGGVTDQIRPVITQKRIGRQAHKEADVPTDKHAKSELRVFIEKDGAWQYGK